MQETLNTYQPVLVTCNCRLRCIDGLFHYIRLRSCWIIASGLWQFAKWPSKCVQRLLTTDIEYFAEVIRHQARYRIFDIYLKTLLRSLSFCGRFYSWTNANLQLQLKLALSDFVYDQTIIVFLPNFIQKCS